MLIKNYDALAINQSRADGLTILDAGLAAISPDQIAGNIVRVFNNHLYVRDEVVCDLSAYERIYIVGAGKVAAGFVQRIESMFEHKLAGGIVLSNLEGQSDKITYVEATHPLPSQKNVDATKKLVEIVQSADTNDLVIAVITGGGSSMLALPAGITIEKQAELTNLLMKAGADIFEVNTVRKHTSLIKGGHLCSYAAKTNMVGLIFSDVIGDDLSMVASGPTVMDATTVNDAENILRKYNLQDFCVQNECKLNETPKNKQILDKVKNYLVVSNKVALAAMEQKARELGYKPIITKESISGESRYVGNRLISMLNEPGLAVIAGGETTVKVVGKGRGGRNQELVLSSLSFLKKGQVLISCSSDGVDNNTQFAGAIGDSVTLEQAESKMLSPEIFLDNNDSNNFFTQEGDGIVTGKLSSNVADLMLALSAKD